MTPNSRLFRFRELGIFAVLILLMVYFGSATDNHVFLKKDNLVDILRQSSILGIAAVGMTMVILTAGIDLSVGSVMALVGLLSAIFAIRLHIPWFAVVPMAMIIGLACGGFHATCITRLTIPPLITTLGTMAAIRGAVQWITGAQAVYLPADPGGGGHAAWEATKANWEVLTWMGSGSVGPVPAPVIVVTIVTLFGWVFLNRTIWGRYLYGIGSNEKACRLSGVNVPLMKYVTYGLAALIFAIAGLVNMGRQGYALPAAATGFELDVITAVVLGGVSIMGGEGKLWGVVVAVLILGVLDNGLTMLNAQFYQISVIKGCVLLIAVGLDRFIRRGGNA